MIFLIILNVKKYTSKICLNRIISSLLLKWSPVDFYLHDQKICVTELPKAFQVPNSVAP